MIKRCYCENFHKECPTYSGCEVCKEWHNFQNFADWYNENYPKDGMKYQLDKDIKIDGNKVYSPETCLFVTKNQNVIKSNAKHFSFLNHEGVTVNLYNLKEFCIKNNLNDSQMCLVNSGKIKHHKGWTKA